MLGIKANGLAIHCKRGGHESQQRLFTCKRVGKKASGLAIGCKHSGYQSQRLCLCATTILPKRLFALDITVAVCLSAKGLTVSAANW